jgi:DNA-binding CsgD family transcriptional regulator
MSYKRTAQQLGISIDTVRSNIRSVYGKLQVHNVAEAVSRALREGIV